MAITLVQSKTATSTTSGADPTATFDNPVVSGHLLVAVVNATDTAGEVASAGWTICTNTNIDNGGDAGIYIAYRVASGTGQTHTPTTHNSGGYGLTLKEFDLTNALLDVDGGDTYASSTTYTSNSVTPTASRDILIVGGAQVNATGRTFSNDVVNGSTSGVNHVATVDQSTSGEGVQSAFWKNDTNSSGSYTAGSTVSSAGSGACVIAVFRSSAVNATFSAALASATASASAAAFSSGAVFGAALASGSASAPVAALAGGAVFGAALASATAQAYAAVLENVEPNVMAAAFASASASASAATFASGGQMPAGFAAAVGSAPTADLLGGAVFGAMPALATALAYDSTFAQSGVLSAALAAATAEAYPARGFYGFRLASWTKALDTPPPNTPAGRWELVGTVGTPQIVGGPSVTGDHCLSGPLADRPTGGRDEGDIYTATDTDQVFVWIAEGP